MKKLGVRHDVLAIEVVDPRELELPDGGAGPGRPGVRAAARGPDVRSGTAPEVCGSGREQRAAIARTLRAAGAAHLRLRTDTDWLLDMVRFVAAQRHARTRGTTR